MALTLKAILAVGVSVFEVSSRGSKSRLHFVRELHFLTKKQVPWPDCNYRHSRCFLLLLGLTFFRLSFMS